MMNKGQEKEGKLSQHTVVLTAVKRGSWKRIGRKNLSLKHSSRTVSVRTRYHCSAKVSHQNYSSPWKNGPLLLLMPHSVSIQEQTVGSVVLI